MRSGFKRISEILFFIILFFNSSIAQHEISSPDGTIAVKINVAADISFSIIVDGVEVLKPSIISMTTNDGFVMGKEAKVKSVDKTSEIQILKPQVKVKSAEVKDHYNAIDLTFDRNYRLSFRAYDNGVAYQFITDIAGPLIIQSETANFSFKESSKVYFPRETQFFSHNERIYEYNALDTLNEKDLCSLPALVEASDKIKLLFTETALLNYPGMWLTGGEGNALNATFPPFALAEAESLKFSQDGRDVVVTKSADYIAKTSGKRSFPWRIICVSKNDGDLITNQLSYQLAPPSKIEDASWIKPGKVAWDWWNYNNIYGVDFRAGVNTETYKYYIDFASEFGLEYIILDEGWYKLREVLTIVPEMDVKEIIAYGKSKNVDVILWLVWSSLDEQLIEALDTYASWGVKGLKIDFMQRDDQKIVEYYERISMECAKRKLLVDFHGSYKPAGLRRMYPNVITREGLKGAENNKWEALITPTHNVTLPFTRMVAGPMDYTPGAMLNASTSEFKISFNRPMAQGTRAHQVGMYTCFESPLQMLCDNPSNYLKEKESTAFIAQIPTVWDETKVLHAKVGKYLAVARRNGDKWYIGAMSGASKQELKIDLSFLGAGMYNIEIFKDGMNADRYAGDYKILKKVVSSKDVLSAELVAGGGWNAIFTRR